MHLTRAILILSLLSPALSRAIPLDRALDTPDTLESTRELGQRLRSSLSPSPSPIALLVVEDEFAADGSSSRLVPKILRRVYRRGELITSYRHSRFIDGEKREDFVGESKDRIDSSDERATLDPDEEQRFRWAEGDTGAGAGAGAGAGSGGGDGKGGADRRIVRRQATSTSPSPSQFQSPSPPTPTPSPSPIPTHKSKKPLIIGATLGALALFLLSFFSCFCFCCPTPAAGMSFGVGGKGTPAIARFSCSCWRHD